jgi:hypothetical protein
MRNFSCDRTCPLLAECIFGPVLRTLGGTYVHSHTVRVRVEFRNIEALRAAVLQLNGQWLGNGNHALYQTQEVGHGFRLPNWRYPLVLRPDGSLALDDYHGAWGNRADIDRLKAAYAVAAAERQCAELGWYTERQADGSLLIYHPSGATMTVAADGTVDAQGFHGQGCESATHAIAQAIGGVTDSLRKPEYYAPEFLSARVKGGGGGDA